MYSPDIILLDLDLTDADGSDAARQIRVLSKSPLLIISGRDDERTKVNALDDGADDYITKPFGVAELMARIRVALRRAGRPREVPTDVVHVGRAICIDLANRILVVRGEEVHTSPIEYKILD